MGLFTRQYGNDDLRDVGYLANTKISHAAPRDCWPTFPSQIATTMAHRLGHLIYRMETRPCTWTCIASKWYLENLNRVSLPRRAVSLIDPLAEQLRRAVSQYERNTGTMYDGTYVEKLVNYVRNGRVLVLYGPCGYNYSGAYIRPFPQAGTPTGDLMNFAMAYCWNY
jgi:hypothetical protein